MIPDTRPHHGLCLPVRYIRVRDGDTMEVCRMHSGHKWAIRLADCNCPELHDEGGKAARDYADNVLSRADEGDIHVFIPLPDSLNLLSMASFDRLVGVVYVGTRRLGQMLIERGLGTIPK